MLMLADSSFARLNRRSSSMAHPCDRSELGHQLRLAQSRITALKHQLDLLNH